MHSILFYESLLVLQEKKTHTHHSRLLEKPNANGIFCNAITRPFDELAQLSSRIFQITWNHASLVQLLNRRVQITHLKCREIIHAACGGKVGRGFQFTISRLTKPLYLLEASLFKHQFLMQLGDTQVSGKEQECGILSALKISSQPQDSARLYAFRHGKCTPLLYV